MEFKNFIKENERDFSDYVGLKKQVSNLRSKIKKGEMAEENANDIERIKQEIESINQKIDDIEKQIRKINSSIKKGGILHRMFNKDKYYDESNELDTLYIERKKLVEEKNRIEEEYTARAERAKLKQQIPEMENQVKSLESEIKEKKEKLIELIDDQISDNFKSTVHTESEKQKTLSSLTSNINKLRARIRQMKELVQVELVKKLERQLDEKICKKEESEKKFEEDLESLKVQKKLYENLKMNIDDDKIITELLNRVVDKTRENQDRQVTILGRNYSANQGIELSEAKDKSDEYINAEGDKKNDIEGLETVPQDTRLNETENDWYYNYIKQKMEEEADNDTIILEQGLFRFNPNKRHNNKGNNEREAI